MMTVIGFWSSGWRTVGAVFWQLESEVVQHSVGHGGLGDDCDDLHGDAASVASEDIDSQGAAQQLGPGEALASRRWWDRVTVVFVLVAAFVLVVMLGGDRG